ncbi:MAG: spore cortex biosynthesis protein YabQ [Clostridia bacterium]|nr:spore cortex biosynthesis protein YabQ [Clostridia bacterium]
MWEIKNSFQLFSFAVSFLVGIIYCLIYDVLRAIRKTKQLPDTAVFLQDICYFILIAISTFIIFISLSNGEIRGYLLLAMALGFTACFVTLSRLTVKLFALIFKFLNNLSEKLIDIINRFFDITASFIAKILKNCHIKLNNIKKILKNHLKKTG